MQVYTTIFLAEKTQASLEGAAETGAPDKSALYEVEDAQRECILTLETRNWWVEDDPAR